MKYFLLCALLLPASLWSQGDFICSIDAFVGEVARGGGWVGYRFDGQKPNLTIEEIGDGTLVVKDTLGNLLVNDTLVFLGTKAIGGRQMAKNTAGKWAVLEADFTPVIGFEYDDLSFEMIEPPLTTMVRKGTKWGFVDSTNTVILPIIYDKVRLLNPRTAFLEKDGNNFLFHLERRKLIALGDRCVQIPKSLERTDYFLFREEDRVGVWNTDGEEVVAPDYTEIAYQACQFAGEEEYTDVFLLGKHGRFGAYSPDGKILIPPRYHRIIPAGGMLRLGFGNQGYHQLHNGRQLIPYVFAQSHSQLLDRYTIIVEQAAGFGVFNYQKAEFLIEPRYGELTKFRDTLLHFRQDGKYGVVDWNGQVRIPALYDEPIEYRRMARRPDLEYLRVKQDGRYGLRSNDSPFAVVLEPTYHVIMDFAEGRARVMKDGKWGYVDRNWNVVIDLQYTFANGFSNGRAEVIDGEERRFIDAQGKCVLNCD